MTVIKYDLEWSRQPAVKSKSGESARGSARKEAGRDQSRDYETGHTKRETDRQTVEITYPSALPPTPGRHWSDPSTSSLGASLCCLHWSRLNKTGLE